VTATWNGLHVTSPPNFTTLGPYYFTQYNSIYESTCTGSKATAFVFTGTGSCAYNLLTGANGLASNFISQVTLNGTGVSANPAVGLIAGFRGTGIGCYFDDELHRALGLKGHDWQSLYHFTIGKPVEDLRLRAMPPYAHLKTGVRGP